MFPYIKPVHGVMVKNVILFISSVWHNGPCVTWTRENIRNNPSSYTLRAYNIGKQAGCFHLMKVQPEIQSLSTGRRLSLLDIHDQGVLEWCLSGKVHIGGPMRKRCHVAAIDIIGRRILNLDPEVYCCTIWSTIFSYLNEHDIWPNYDILSQWLLHANLK